MRARQTTNLRGSRFHLNYPSSRCRDHTDRSEGCTARCRSGTALDGTRLGWARLGWARTTAGSGTASSRTDTRSDAPAGLYRPSPESENRSASSRRFVEHMDSLLQENNVCNNFN